MDALGTIGSLPKKIGDVTASISKGADSLDKMVVKMDAAVKGAQTKNPVSGAIVKGASKTTETLAKGTAALNNAGKKIQATGAKLSTLLQPLSTAAQSVKQSLQDLQNCQEVMLTSALVVNAVVDSCSGHFHPRANEKVLTKFDGQWDSWAKTINDIYQSLSPTGKANILESLAKAGFGDSVFYLGSAIKNESAGIFGGIADFEDALHAFRGSYRNPAMAAKKIEAGVKGIVNATERVANAVNNIIKTYQKGMGNPVTGNPILSYIGNLHNTKAIATVNKVLTVGGKAADLASDVQSIQSALKSKDPKAIFSAGKKTVDDAKKLVKGIKGTAASTKSVTPPAKGAATGGLSSGNPASANSQTSPESAQNGGENDEDGGGGQADSYVCSGATMRCTFGDKKSKLTVYPDRTVFLTGQPMANISDHVSLYNIAPFGKCHTTSYPATGAATAAAHGKLTPMPCIPGTVSKWLQGKGDYIIKGDPALLKSSFCRCCYGGVITITDDGQRDTGAADLGRLPAETFETWETSVADVEMPDAESILDGLQLGLSVAGFFPGLGAVPDLLNAAIYAARGSWADAGLSVLSAVPLVGDAAAAVKFAKVGVNTAKAGKIAKSVRAGEKVRGEIPPTVVNRVWKKYAGYDNPPYRLGGKVQSIELTENTTFVRVYTKSTSKKEGRWIMRKGDIEGLSPQQIKDKFALQEEPTFICDVELPKGTRLHKGVVNKVETWGNGGGTQYDTRLAFVGKFTKERPIGHMVK